MAGLILTLPALWKVNIGTADAPIYTVTAFFAVVSIGVLGLYLAFAIPIFLPLAGGRLVQAGLVEPGQQVEVDGPDRGRRDPDHVGLLHPAALPGRCARLHARLPRAPSTAEVPFDWKFVNYAPLVLGAIFIALWIGWHVSAKHWFTGPKHTIDLPAGMSSRRRDRARAREGVSGRRYDWPRRWRYVHLAVLSIEANGVAASTATPFPCRLVVTAGKSLEREPGTRAPGGSGRTA